jgi:hypothetical protein
VTESGVVIERGVAARGRVHDDRLELRVMG